LGLLGDFAAWHGSGTLARGVRVEPRGGGVEVAPDQVAVDAIDHRNGRPGVPADLEHGQAGGQPFADRAVPQVVDDDAASMVNAWVGRVQDEMRVKAPAAARNRFERSRVSSSTTHI